ncbi:EI24 domain-containing protein [Sulfurimonas sp.]
MQDFLDAIIFGFKEILKTSTMKFAMINGVVVSVVWIAIGFIFWDSIVSFSGSVLSLLPFSMLRSNGAWMLSTFLWLQVVLVTFALIFAFFGNIIVQKVSREKYASFTLLIGLLSALFWGIVWFYESSYIYAQFLKLLTWLPFETIEKGLAYLIGFYLIYTAIIISLIFVASASSSAFLVEIKEKHFPYDRMYEDHEYKTIKKTLRDTGIFTVISIVSFPLLFVPVLNFVLLVGLWIWLMKDTFSSDTAAFVFGDVDKEKLQEYKVGLWSISFIGSLFNFIPVFNVFGPYFTELSMFYYLKEKRDS